MMGLFFGEMDSLKKVMLEQEQRLRWVRD